MMTRFLSILIFTFMAGTALADDRISDSDSAPLLVTNGGEFDPIYANAPGNENFKNGVGSIFVQFASTGSGGFICTASAITQSHILTAAHCLRNGPADAVSRVRFILPSDGLILEASGFSVNPEFDFFEPIVGAFAQGDVAVVELTDPLPAHIEIYELNRATDELRAETQHYGHGRSGQGETGATGGADFFYARTGKNQYDETFEALFAAGFDQLIHDFDSGKGKNDATAWWYSAKFNCPQGNGQGSKCTVAREGNRYTDTGFRKLEVGVAPGDSGGPGFINGKIAGVHSFGFTYGGCEGFTNAPDATCGLDSSFGEMSGDARVSTYAGWIDAQVANGVATPIPEPLPAAPSAAAAGAASDFVSATGLDLITHSVARHMRLEIKELTVAQ